MRNLTLFDDVESGFSTKDPACLSCGLFAGVHSPKMNYTGEGHKRALIIAEAPGAEEDLQGVQLIGPAGQLLRAHLRKHGLDLDQDFWKINAVNCRPLTKSGANRAPNLDEIKCCRPMMLRAIDDLKPQFIWLMGNMALQSFYLDKFSLKDLIIGKWRGLCIPDREVDAYILPLFHPSFIMRNEHDLNLASTFEKDIESAVKCLDKGPINPLPAMRIDLIRDYEKLFALLKKINKDATTFFFDFETTGLKPFRNGHKIVAISGACDGINAFAFPFQWKDWWSPSELAGIKKLFINILTNGGIKKQAHNLKFEDNWAKVILGIDVHPWGWDSMVNAHILDCQRFTRLEFQVYMNFGVGSFKKTTQKFLESKNGEFNNVEKAPLQELLERNAQDALWGFRLARLQKRQMMKKGLINACALFHDGTQEFSEIQVNGMYIDENYYIKIDKELSEKIKEQEASIYNQKECIIFRQKHKRQIDLGSNKDLGILLYEILKLPIRTTAKQNYSVDKDSLDKIDLPFARGLLKLRKLEKIKNTYLAQYMREVCNGRMHPMFDLHIPISFRSSSSLPNFQNVPVRDEESKGYCRKGILPSKGNQLLEIDYSGIEVCVSNCYNKDPVMTNYIIDKSTDMHRDSAADIFLLPHEEITKAIRYETKGDWVFAQFYGSYYKNCAENLWSNCLELKTTSGIKIKDHLRSEKISQLGDFVAHCQEVERKFWDVRFKVYKQWKQDINQFYRDNSYIQSYFGFIFDGYLSFNQVTNLPIQSSAFHLLLWTLIQLQEIKRHEKWETKIIGQIHDSIVFDLFPPEKDHVIETVKRIGIYEAKKTFPWIIVPLNIEFEMAPIDKSWYEKKEIN